MGIEQSLSINSLTQSGILRPAKRVLFEDEFSSTFLAGKSLLNNPYLRLDYNSATKNSMHENRVLQKTIVPDDKRKRMKDIEEFFLRNSEGEELKEEAFHQYQAN